MGFASWLLRMAGWSVTISVPDYKKCIICVAPHTSNWDFVLGKLAYASVGRHAGFLMKETWFKWPLGAFFRALGGIPVPRRKGGNLTEYVIQRFRSADRMQIAVTPEGTRSRVVKWRTGFLYIAMGAGVPIVLGAIDAKHRKIVIEKEFTPTGDVEADMKAIKAYYRQFTALKPEKFCADD